jgi:hypothetical protein
VSGDLLPTAAGVLAVVFVALFAVLPLMRSPRAPSAAVEPVEAVAAERQRLYRQVLELEFDRDTGKVSADDFEALSNDLLGRAAAHLRASRTAEQSIDDQVEREIAAARRALGHAAPRESANGKVEQQEVTR